MPRRLTEFHPGEFYHVYNRGANCAAIFFERGNYLFFLRRLREKLTTEHVTVLAYCLMPNHYHLLVRLESEEFSKSMQAFGTSYTKAINRQTGRTGTLFQGRFQAKHVVDETHLVHLSRYIHLNPVMARLVTKPADWEFSSYPEYAGIREGTLPCTEVMLREFASREHYHRFVETGPAKSPVSAAGRFCILMSKARRISNSIPTSASILSRGPNILVVARRTAVSARIPATSWTTGRRSCERCWRCCTAPTCPSPARPKNDAEAVIPVAVCWNVIQLEQSTWPE